MEIGIVQVHAAQAVMIFVLLVNGRGFGKLGQRFLTELFKAIAILRLTLTAAGAAARGSFAAAGRFGIGFAAQLQCDQPLDVRHVVERASHVAMPWVAFLVQRDGIGKAINGVLVSSLAASDAAIRRANVAESDVVVGLVENSFCLL